MRIIAELERKHTGVHLREISRLVDTGLPNAKRFLEILIREEVVRKEKYANLVRFKLRESQRTVAYLKNLNTEKFLALPSKVRTAINEFLEELEIKPMVAIIFGSCAKGDYTSKSDIDILLVFQKVENEKGIENLARRISMRTNTKISSIYLSYENFEKNFLNKEHGFSGEIRQDVIVLLGVEHYYNMLWRFLK